MVWQIPCAPKCIHYLTFYKKCLLTLVLESNPSGKQSQITGHLLECSGSITVFDHVFRYSDEFREKNSNLGFNKYVLSSPFCCSVLFCPSFHCCLPPSFYLFFYACHDIVHSVCFFFLSQVLWSLPFIYKVAYKSFLLIKRIAIKSGNYTSLVRTGMVEITMRFIYSVHSLHTFLLLGVCQAFLQKLKDNLYNLCPGT